MATDKVVTGEVRFDFPKLFKSKLGPKDKSKKGVDRFSITLILEPTDPSIEKLKAIMEQAKVEKWGAKTPSYVKSPIRKGVQKSNENPFGYDLEAYPAYEGKVIVTASSVGIAPGVVGPDVQPILDADEIYSGCYGRVGLRAFAWVDEDGGNGVSFGLETVQKTRDGERLSGGPVGKPEDDFEPIKPKATGNHLDMLEV